MQNKKAHIIVVGNEKGGSGKSTVALHVIVGLLRLGYRVGSLDLDSHQATLTSAMKNRWRFIETSGEDVPSPEHVHIDESGAEQKAKSKEEESWRVDTILSELCPRHDFVVIDTPGSDRYMSIVGHSYADTLLTPMNDSFVDLDVLAKIDPDTRQMTKPSVYAQMVWDLRRRRKQETGQRYEWFVMRNRLSALANQNKADMTALMQDLQYQLGFRIAPGLHERVIYRELFLKGLTLLDLREGDPQALSMSNINARQEVRALVRRLLPQKDVSTLSLLKTY